MNDHGYEPWARANVKNHAPLTTEQGAELLASLDAARAERDRLQGRVNRALRLCEGAAQLIPTDAVRDALKR